MFRQWCECGVSVYTMHATLCMGDSRLELRLPFPRYITPWLRAAVMIGQSILNACMEMEPVIQSEDQRGPRRRHTESNMKTNNVSCVLEWNLGHGPRYSSTRVPYQQL